MAQTRRVLSCVQCRSRKVKARFDIPSCDEVELNIRQCDRIKPCSACCLSGRPKACDFSSQEADDDGPVQQSDEIERLRKENSKLKEEIDKLQDHMFTNYGDDMEISSGLPKALLSAWRRCSMTGNRTDNLYFGTPDLKSITSGVRCNPKSS